MMQILLFGESHEFTSMVLDELSRTRARVIISQEQEGAMALLSCHRFDTVMINVRPIGMGGAADLGFFRFLHTNYPGTHAIGIYDPQSNDASVDQKAHTEKAVLQTLGSAVFDMTKQPGRLQDYLQAVLSFTVEDAGAPLKIDRLENLEEFLGSSALTSVYQPIMDIQGNRKAVAYEALTRANTDSLLGNPGLLFSYAAQKELFSKIDAACLTSALALSRGLPASIDLFLNIQPRSLTNVDFAEGLLSAVTTNGHKPENVVLELTEQREVLNPRMFTASLKSLKEMGFRIAVDDFGEGNANLEMLLHVMPDFIKISGRICRHVTKVKVVRSMITAITQTSKEEGIRTIAEFIETEADALLLAELGVDLGQGWHLGKPADPVTLKFPET